MAKKSASFETNFSQQTKLTEYWKDRILRQLDFAQYLTDRHKKRAWQRQIDKARKLLDSCKVMYLDAVRDTAIRVEKTLKPVADVAKRYTIYCAGHAHIDMNWMWSWPETVAVVNDTMTTVLRLMDEFPAFTFTQSQASIYKILADHNPELLDAIRKRVNEGRWEGRRQPLGRRR